MESWTLVTPERPLNLGSPFVAATGESEVLCGAFYGPSRRWRHRPVPDPWAGLGPYSWTHGGLRLSRFPHEDPAGAVARSGLPVHQVPGAVLRCALPPRDLYMLHPQVGPALEVWLGPVVSFDGKVSLLMDVHGRDDERVPYLNVFGTPERDGLWQLQVRIHLHTRSGSTVRGYPDGGGSGAPWGNTGPHWWTLPVSFRAMLDTPDPAHAPGTLPWLGIEQITLTFGTATRNVL